MLNNANIFLNRSCKPNMRKETYILYAADKKILIIEKKKSEQVKM